MLLILGGFFVDAAVPGGEIFVDLGHDRLDLCPELCRKETAQNRKNAVGSRTIQILMEDAERDGGEDESQNQPQHCHWVVLAVNLNRIAERSALIFKAIGGLQLEVLKSRHELFCLEKGETGSEPRKSCQKTEIDREIRQQMEAVEPVAAVGVAGLEIHAVAHDTEINGIAKDGGGEELQQKEQHTAADGKGEGQHILPVKGREPPHGGITEQLIYRHAQRLCQHPQLRIANMPLILLDF